MYIRPRLNRNKTENLEKLTEEHVADTTLYKNTLETGNDFVKDCSKIQNTINDISVDRQISENDKKLILESLYTTLGDIEKEHNQLVLNTLTDIEFSIKERIDETEDAIKQREHEVYKAESTMWETNYVDKYTLVKTRKDIHRKYQEFQENSKSVLNDLVKEKVEQQEKVLDYKRKDKCYL